MNDSRYNRVLACLDDARTSMLEAEKTAAELVDELPRSSAYWWGLKRVARNQAHRDDINNQITYLQGLATSGCDPA